MGAPPIQFTSTSDGARIAYWVLGDGPTVLVQMPYPWSHVRNEWDLPEVASWNERLGAGRTLISYDMRGMGLSEVPPDPVEPGADLLDMLVSDLGAVLDAAGVDRVVLLGFWIQALAAIRFASEWPERVSHLVLWGASAHGAAMYNAAVTAATKMVDVDVDQYARVVAHSFIGWSRDDKTDRFVDRMIDAVLPNRHTAVSERRRSREADYRISQIGAVDLSEQAGRLQVPTLVLHARENTFVSQGTATELAAEIPDAKLVLLDGESLHLAVEVTDQALEAINSFIAEPASSDAPQALPSTKAEAGSAGGPPYPDGLSKREVEMLRLVASGASNPEIAATLVISINTVTSHITSIYRKTETNNRVEATRYAITRRLTE